MKYTPEERERCRREKEDQAYSRWLDLRRRGPRVWLIAATVAVFLVFIAAFIASFVGWGWYGGGLSLAALVLGMALVVKSTSDELWPSALILGVLAAACHVIVVIGCATGSAAQACS